MSSSRLFSWRMTNSYFPPINSVCWPLQKANLCNFCATEVTREFLFLGGWYGVIRLSEGLSIRTKDDIHVVLEKGYCHRVESSLFVTCTNNHFLMKDCRKRISIEETTCSQKQEPLIIRSSSQCSPIGVDGRTNKLDTLVRVSIGWQLHESTFFEQIGLCVDESSYGTVWTKHTLHGESIAHRDTDFNRPGFRVDTTRSKR